MFPLRDLQYLLEPSSLALVATALSVVLLSAFRALIHDRESERHRDMSASAITLDTNRALLLPLASSVSLLLMFYLFATVSQLVTAFAAVASASATCFALSPLVAWLNTSLGLQDPLITVYFPSFSLWSGQHGNSNNSNSSSSNSSSSNTSSNSNSSSSGSRRGEGGGSSGGTLLGEGMRGRESRSSTNINSSSNSSDGHNRSVSRNNSASGKTNTSTTTSTTTTSTSTSTSTSSSSAYITAGEGGSTVLGAVTRMQLVLGVLSGALVLCWLVSGHWLLNNALGTAICVAFVSHVRLPNVKVSALLLACLFAYDIFWVFFSHRFFGANVMVSVATQQAHNPAHTVAQSLRLPTAVSGSIVREIELPVKLLFPRDLFGELKFWGGRSGGRARDFMVLGLGDMAIPGMLLALVLCVDQHKRRQQQEEEQEREMEALEAATGGEEQHQELQESSQKHFQKHTQQHLDRPLLESSTSGPPVSASRHKSAQDNVCVERGMARGRGQLSYVWVAAAGYTVGLVAALAAGVLTRSPQPALLYLVPSTLGPVSLEAWRRGELTDLWEGSPGLMPFDPDKLDMLDV